MELGRYLVEAHLLEKRPVGELAEAHGVHRSWIYKLLARYREGGVQALEPRSRRPRRSPRETPSEVVEAIVELRKQLHAEGHDCGPATIAYHLRRLDRLPSISTIHRILGRAGLITPQPQKRPACSRIRFEADLPNQMWQADSTHWSLACGAGVEILNLIDDHSRLFLASQAFSTIKAKDVVDTFHKAADRHGLPAALLSDNGAVFTGSYRGGKVLLEYELERLGVVFKNSRPYHPQTCGKVERLHQTLKRYLARKDPSKTLSALQQQLDVFAHYYNTIRPHRALEARTPLQAYSARVKAGPTGRSLAGRHFRVRQDKVDQTGKISLRYGSRLYKIGVGRAHKGRAVKLLIAEKSIRVVDLLDGQLIRELTLDPSRAYQPLNAG